MPFLYAYRAVRTTYIVVMGVVRLLHLQPLAAAAVSCRGAQMSTV